MKIQILELGSNSFQLCGFDVNERGVVHSEWVRKLSVRLAQGLGADGLLDAPHVQRALDAIDGLMSDAPWGRDAVCIATSALRTAANREGVLGPLRERYGIEARVLSGAEEAELAHAGALATLVEPASRRREDTGSRGEFQVVDIGGGSTEIAVGDDCGVAFTFSAPVGTLLGSRILPAYRRELEAVLIGLASKASLADRLVFASGSARALRRYLVAEGLVAAAEPVPTEIAAAALPELERVSVEQLRAHGIGPERHETLAPGAQLIVAIARSMGAPRFEVTSGGVREGAALREGAVQRGVRSDWFSEPGYADSISAVLARDEALLDARLSRSAARAG